VGGREEFTSRGLTRYHARLKIFFISL